VVVDVPTTCLNRIEPGHSTTPQPRSITARSNTMTITENLNPTSDTLTETAPPRRVNSEVVDLAAALDAAADAATLAAADIETPGVRRRADKLARQIRAAARLVARGAHLDTPRFAAPLLRRAATAQVTDDLASLDARITQWSATIRSCHEWRGHTASLPD
jgi:hypothetical protein